MTRKNNKMLAAVLFLLALLLPGSALADGLIIIPQPPPRPWPFPQPMPFPLEVVYHHVDVTIEGRTATTKIEQVFRNPTSARLEGYYLFPIPDVAVIDEFAMDINGTMTPAELLDAEKARRIYEDIVRQMRDPALLEYTGKGAFKARIFPIEPNSDKKVTITYTEVLPLENNTVEYLYPLNTEKFSSKKLEEVSVTVTVASETPIAGIFSTTHDISVKQEDKYNALAAYEEEDVKPDTDFKLYVTLSDDPLGFTLLSYREPGEDGYFLLSAAPAFAEGGIEPLPKDITFILDVSGSMAGEKLDKAKAALVYCIENLRDEDRFQLVRFSTEARRLFDGLREADSERRLEARQFVDELRPVGGTNIEEAFTLALQDEAQSSRPHFVLFITDGKPTIGEREDDKLVTLVKEMNQEKSRIFTFGIGSELNTHLLDRITGDGGGVRSYISEGEDIELKISAFFDKVNSPVMTGLTLEIDDAGIDYLYPSELPDLFRGSSLILLGRYEHPGDIAGALRGKVMGENLRYVFEGTLVKDNTKKAYLPKLWAARRVGHLLDLVRLHGESEELKDEIVQLARQHGIVTPYTSYLILEDEAARPVLPRELQTMNRMFDNVPGAAEELRGEYEAAQRKSGSGSVQASEEMRDLNSAVNLAQTNQGQQRIPGANAVGNVEAQIRNVAGRAQYLAGDFWVDSKLQEVTPGEQQRIQFATDEYFALLESNMEAAQFLALGKNVRFLLDGVYYEIYE